MLKQDIKNNTFVLAYPDNSPHIRLQQLNELFRFVFQKNDIKLFNVEKIVPKNQDEVKTILEECHSSKLSGHYGFNKTYARVQDRYYWTSMKSDIRNFVKTCHSCQMNKTNFKPTKQPMEITTTAECPLERIAFDVVGPLPLTESGNRFIITAQDDLTKFSFATPTPDHEAETVAKKLVLIFTTFGIPKSILTDKGTEFMSNLIKELTTLFKTKHISTTPYHPQTNGALERSHLTLKDYLKHFIRADQTDWDEYIPFAMFSYNTAKHKSTGYTPYELMFGKKAYIPSSIQEDPKFHYTYDDYIRALQYKLNTSFKIARENIISSKERSKNYHDKRINPREFEVNDLVKLKIMHNVKGKSRKLSAAAKGPFKIVKIYDDNNVDLQIGNQIKRYHFNLIDHYFPDESSSD